MTQLLKRNFTLQNVSYDKPKILKLPQGEMRWAPRRVDVDEGDVVMNMRMDDSKTKFIGESVSKYAKGLNPYGESTHPYKVNKQFRPPIVHAKYFEPLSRMPVKFENINAGPIVEGLYKKQVKIDKFSPRMICDKNQGQQRTNMEGYETNERGFTEGEISLRRKQPHSSIPYHPSMPFERNTGVPEMELDRKLHTAAHAGIHGPFHHSDQSRDVRNLRTPMHVALTAGYKDPHTNIQITPDQIQEALDFDKEYGSTHAQASGEYTVDPVLKPDLSENLVPKITTAGWYNPSYYLTDQSWQVSDYQPAYTKEQLEVSGQSKPHYDILDNSTLQNDIGIYTHIDDKVKTSGQVNTSFEILDGAKNDRPVRTRQKLNVEASNNLSWYSQEGEKGEVSLRDSLHQQEYTGDRNSMINIIHDHPEYSIQTNMNRNTRTNQEKFNIFKDNENVFQPQVEHFNVQPTQPNQSYLSSIREKKNTGYTPEREYIDEMDKLSRAVTNIRQNRSHIKTIL